MWFALILAVAAFVVAAVVLAYVVADRIAYHNFSATLTEKERQQFDGFLAVNTDWRMFERMTADERDAAVKVKESAGLLPVPDAYGDDLPLQPH